MAKHQQELKLIKATISKLRKRINALKSKGIDVDPQILAALAQANTDVDGLIAKPAGGVITADTAQKVLDGLAGISSKAKAATAA